MKQKSYESITDPERLLTGVTISQIIGLLDGSYDLSYIDYRDNFDNQLPVLQECIQKGSLEPIFELTDDWFCDSEYESVSYILGELHETVANQDDWWDEDWFNDDPYHYDNLNNGLTWVFEDYSDWLYDAIYERDKSDPVGGMIRNTGELTLHYRIGYEIANMGGALDADEFWGLKRALGIKRRDTTWDEDLAMLLQQADYGGQLIVFFMDDFATWAKNFPDKINTIQFKDPHICIWDGWNGSGDDVVLKGHTITLSFDRTDIYIDETCHYNYSQSVCGMVRGFCSSTEVTLLHKRRRVKK